MNAFYEGLADILEVPAAGIGPDFSLEAHGWDSLAVISCVALIDECYGSFVSGSAIAACRTVGDLDALVLSVPA